MQELKVGVEKKTFHGGLLSNICQILISSPRYIHLKNGLQMVLISLLTNCFLCIKAVIKIVDDCSYKFLNLLM